MSRFFTLGLLFLIFSCQSLSDLGVLVPPTVDQDPDLPRLSVNVAGRQRFLHLRTFGNAANPHLYFLHGSFTDMRPYQNILEALAVRYFVVAWDQRGCGLSERIAEDEFTLESAREEVVAVKNQLSFNQKITLIGHSWGGGLASAFTSAFPGQVAQLVLMEPIPLKDSDMQKLFKTIVEFSYENESWNQMARHGQALSPKDHEQLDYRGNLILRSTMTKSYHCDEKNPPEWQVSRVGAFVEYVRNKRLGSLSGTQYTFHYNFVEGMDRFQDSVLILGGSCSSLGYKTQLKYSKPHFPSAHVVEIKQAGHRMNVEQFEAVMSALKTYLNAF
jgi:proline iminopeptidase